MQTHPISTAGNDPGNDSTEILEPVDIGEQAGVGDF